VTGNGHYGLFFGQAQKRRTLLNYNPALTFNGVEDSIRILYNLDSLNELTIMAVFQPSDTSEAGVWGTTNALARNTLMTTRQVIGPDGMIDSITPAQKSALLSTVIQNWRQSATISPSAYIMLLRGAVL